jgi:hypothetical protein
MSTVRAALVIALALSGCNERRADSTHAPSPVPEGAPPALTAAHEAYLGADYVTMGERLRDVLADPRTSELARDNAFELLESAYDATHGQLPSRAAFPATVRGITFGTMNGVNPYGTHRMVYLKVRLDEGRAAHVKELRLTRLPGEPILDLAQKRGAVRSSKAEKGVEEIALEIRNVEVLPDRGAFAIQLAFDDGPGLDTFVLANKLVASAQPEVTSPDVGQVFKDPRPPIAWHPYRSPEYAAWETRGVNIAVSSEAKPDAWSLYQFQPGDLGQATPAPLDPGAYWVSVMYAEDRGFGPIRIQRATDSGRPFTVVP